MPIRVIHVGLGPIGAGVVRQVASRKGFLIVGAVDIDPAKVGQGSRRGVRRRPQARREGRPTTSRRPSRPSRPDVAVLCTSSSLKKVVPEFEAVLKLKVPIVSTTEELAYPVKSNARGGEEDRRAGQARARRRARHRRQSRVSDGRAADRADGRLRDAWTAIEVDRVQDARIRRLPFQQKIGAGLTREQFMDKVKDGTRPPRRPRRVDHDDRRRDGLEARPGHRRHPAEDRREARVERVPDRRGRPGRAA